jgi:ketosteroid isomerase-like protein
MAEDPNIEFLRDLYAAWARGDYSNIVVFDPDIELLTDYPEQRTYRGLDGMRQGWFDFLSAWKDFTTQAEEIIAGSDDRYVVLVRLRGVGRESGAARRARIRGVTRRSSGGRSGPPS